MGVRCPSNFVLKILKIFLFSGTMPLLIVLLVSSLLRNKSTPNASVSRSAGLLPIRTSKPPVSIRNKFSKVGASCLPCFVRKKSKPFGGEDRCRVVREKRNVEELVREELIQSAIAYCKQSFNAAKGKNDQDPVTTLRGEELLREESRDLSSKKMEQREDEEVEWERRSVIPEEEEEEKAGDHTVDVLLLLFFGLIFFFFLFIFLKKNI